MAILNDIDNILASLRNEAAILRDLSEDPDPRLVQIELDHRWFHRPAPTYAIESGLVFRMMAADSQPITFPKPKSAGKPKLIVIGHAFPSRKKPEKCAVEMKAFQNDNRDCNLFVKYRIAHIREGCKKIKPTSLENFRKIHHWARDAIRWLKVEQKTLRHNLDLVVQRNKQPRYVRDQYDAEI